MKKNVVFALFLLMSFVMFAQNDVTKFLGIPVDGFKPEMISQLKAKGFVEHKLDKDVLVGEFNGIDVNVHIVTNNNKVCRIMLCDQNTISETDIKIRFNKLCNQFTNNPKYASFDDYTIPDEEDISYQMNVNSKRYEAVFYQEIQKDSTEIANELLKIFSQKYTEEDLQNPTEELKNEIVQTSFSYAIDLMTKKSVWFMISEHYGEYYITMFYDNEYNKANGEDL